MFTRIILILAFAVQQFMLPALYANSIPQVCECTPSSQVVTQTTCCSNQMISHGCTCSSACNCGMKPSQPEAPKPTIPTTNTVELFLTILAQNQPITFDRFDFVHVTQLHAEENLQNDHTTIQARLGIWRT